MQNGMDSKEEEEELGRVKTRRSMLWGQIIVRDYHSNNWHSSYMCNACL